MYPLGASWAVAIARFENVGGYIGIGLSVILSVRSSVRHNFVSAQYFKNSLMNLSAFCMCIDIDMI